MVSEFLASLVSILSNPTAMLFIIIGTLIGLFVGGIPGLGGAVALTLLLPLTFGLDPLIAIVFLAAAKGGVIFSGSITAILLNTPGSPANTATLLDGYPMAQNGEADKAIGASAMGSAGGAIIGILILVLLLPVIQSIVILFGPPEFFVLTIVGLISIAVAIKGAMLSGLVGAGLGLVLSFHGSSPITGTIRYTFGTQYLFNGFPLIPAIIGVFAIAEAIHLAGKKYSIARSDIKLSGGRMEGVHSVFRHKVLFLQSAVIGLIVGAIPAVGGSVAGFVSYVQAVQISNDPDMFGKGSIEGVIATESANDAKDAGDLVPTLALGIPGSAGAAVLLGAFVLHGLNPGPSFLSNHLDIAYAIFVALIISNILTSIIGLALADYLARITQMPTPIISALIIAVAVPGSYAIRNNPLDMVVALGFGFLGFLFIIANISRIALIIALVLGPIAEDAFHQSIQISQGGYTVFFTRPLSAGIIAIFVLILALPLIRRRLSTI